jgi:putative DNA primase/helicase
MTSFENLQPSYEQLIARADFDWVSVLTDAGAGAYLTGRNGPCPFCGGTDRFAFSPRKVAWVCRHCTGGYASCRDFLMRFMGYTEFRQLADHVRRFYGYQPGSAAPSVLQPARPPMRKARVIRERAWKRMEKIWNEARAVADGDPVDRYLRARLPGLQSIPREIRTHPALDYWDAPANEGDSPVHAGTFPAMLVRGFDAEGNWVQLHKTHVTSEGRKAPVAHPKKTCVGLSANSFAFRLGEPEGDTLGLSEGIETALAASLLSGMVVWPCHSSSVLPNFILPEYLRPRVRRIVIYADSDRAKQGKRAGSVAAAALARRLRKAGLNSTIVRAGKVDTDMADLVERGGPSGLSGGVP